MRTSTIVSLGASAVLGVAALFVAKTWLPTATSPGPQVAAPPQANLTPVVVAAKPLAYGARLEAASLTIVRLPAGAVPAGAFSTVEQVLAHDNGAPVTLTQISEREAVLPTKLSGPGARASVAAMVAEGMRAYSIGVSADTGVGGNALPGDRVDVVLTRDLTPDGDRRTYASDIVVQNVRVLGVDLNADPTSTETAVPQTATLEASVQDAQKLAVAAKLGDLSLALRRTGAGEVEATRLVRASDVSAYGAPRTAPASAPARPRAAVAAPPKRQPVVVVSGDRRDPVDVPAEHPRTGA